jgi:hypothetical protein
MAKDGGMGQVMEVAMVGEGKQGQHDAWIRAPSAGNLARQVPVKRSPARGLPGAKQQGQMATGAACHRPGKLYQHGSNASPSEDLHGQSRCYS